jgi:hypothetical protein
MQQSHIEVNHPIGEKKSLSANSALWQGILFSLAFTALIAWTGQRLDPIQLLPDQGVAWYYWRLPNPTFWNHATVWGFYLLHKFLPAGSLASSMAGEESGVHSRFGANGEKISPNYWLEKTHHEKSAKRITSGIRRAI